MDDITQNNDTMWKQILKSFNPFAMLFSDYNVDKIPFSSLIKDDLNRKMIVNTIFASAGTLAGASLLKAISHKVNARKWDKKNKKIVTDKVNALYPLAIPTSNTSEDMVEDVRKIGLDSLYKKAGGIPDISGAVDNIAAQLRSVMENAINDIKDNVSEGWNIVKNTGERSLKGVVPLTAAMTAAVLAPGLVQERLENKDSDELDEDIAAKRQELNNLHARLIDLNLHKHANGKENTEAVDSHIMNFLTLMAAASAGLMVPGLWLATNNYLKNNDRNRKIMKAGEMNAARNLTNIPQRIGLHVDANGRPAKTKKAQRYVQDLKELASNAAIDNMNEIADKQIKQLEAPPQDDFTEKVTKIQKDALFS